MMVQQLFCNHCGDLCRHIYFKCLQCPSYTICQLCVQDSEIRSKHSPENHMFFGEPQTSYRAETPSCKGCLRDVSQMRHKCLECSSYDLCDQCYPVLGRDHGHGFAKVTSPWDVFFHGPALFLENSKNLDSNIRCDICQGGFDQGSYFLRVRRNAPSDKICTTCEASADKPELREYPLVKIRTKLSFYTASSNSKPPAGAFCDVCSTSIFGERYKCVDCPDYDMCGSCLVKQRSRHTAAHRFIEVNRRCNICKEAIIGISYRCKLCLDGAGQVHDFCSDCAFGPNNTHAASHPAVAPLSTLVCFGPSSNIRPQLHEPGSQNTIHIGIRCDLCNTSELKGLRMKCLDCHDFDTCATCFRSVCE
ncbi:hypothetical protein FRC03_005187 [Tulasnella sp. 419]|nr:hypothetical protein FRC03_005187 [Tulasnella sp. 419]